jgi:uncharacterized membrane protein
VLFRSISALLFLGVVGTAFETLFNLGASGTLLILSGSLLGSYINIPLTKIKTKDSVLRVRPVRAFGITYHVPLITMGVNETLLTINMGGAIIPLVASFYLLTKAPQAVVNAILAIILVAVMVKIVSRPIRGVGIVSPSFVPPLAAALASLLLGGDRHVVAYVSGSLGTLIGADLLNFKNFPKLGSPIISIGGAGTFDGIFLAGIVAVLIAS